MFRKLSIATLVTLMSEVLSNPKRVVFCIEALTVGGAEQMLVAMANQFVDDGWQVHMVCLTTAGELSSQLAPAVSMHVLDKRPGVDVRLPWRLRQLIDKIDPDAINSHLWTANLWSRLALIGTRYKVVVTEHSRDSWKRWHYRIIDKLLSKFTKRLVAVSNDTADFYRDDIKIDEALVTVINNGVDTARYAAGDGVALRQQWLADDRMLLGTVGRLVPAKNHARLVEMAYLLKQRGLSFKLVIAGEGPGRSEIQALLDGYELGDEVVLLGQRQDIPDVMAALDIFILSSDREGHPLTALEAQAAGTAVLLTRAGGSADAIAGTNNNRFGTLVDKSAESLATAVIAMSKDPLALASMSESAQRYALEHFDERRMIDAYQSLFKSC